MATNFETTNHRQGPGPVRRFQRSRQGRHREERPSSSRKPTSSPRATSKPLVESGQDRRQGHRDARAGRRRVWPQVVRDRDRRAEAFAAVKSPTEFFKLQSDFVRGAFDSYVAEASKNTEAVLKLAGEAAQPISNRFAVAAEKVKTAA